MTPERFRSLQSALRRRQPDLTLVAEGVHKRHNLSALARSCDAAGVHHLQVVAPGGHIERHNLTSGGAWKWQNVQCHDSIEAACEVLKYADYQILVATISGYSVDYRRIDYTRPSAIVVGGELTGVSAAAARLADHQVMIPMHGLVESLNVSVATGLLLYEAARQREAAGLYGKCRLDQETFRRTLFEWCYPAIARCCREQSIAYPALDGDGYLRENPFRNQGT